MVDDQEEMVDVEEEIQPEERQSRLSRASRLEEAPCFAMFRRPWGEWRVCSTTFPFFVIVGETLSSRRGGVLSLFLPGGWILSRAGRRWWAVSSRGGDLDG
jgi:hypothetical protein